MGGLYIDCGSFKGEDKSGSAFSGVLDAIEHRAAGRQQEVIRQLKNSLEEHSEYVEITKSQVEIIEPLLSGYRNELVKMFGHSDWEKVTAEEESAGLNGSDAKYGKGLGWQLYCLTDMIAACKVSIAEDESIFVAYM